MSTKPEVLASNDYVNNLYKTIYADPNPRETLTLLHISDIHLDMLYKEGTNQYCDSYICCREEFGYPTDPQDQAGKWGGYYCDLPLITLQNMLQHIAQNHDIDSIFWTGDNSAHNVWSNSNEEVIDYTLMITNEIKAAFAGKNIPVYPATGNHDTWPVNNEDFSAPGISIPINGIVGDWEEWIGAEAAAEFAQYGYCSIPFKLANDRQVTNSRVLVLNT